MAHQNHVIINSDYYCLLVKRTPKQPSRNSRSHSKSEAFAGHAQLCKKPYFLLITRTKNAWISARISSACRINLGSIMQRQKMMRNVDIDFNRRKLPHIKCTTVQLNVDSLDGLRWACAIQNVFFGENIKMLEMNGFCNFSNSLFRENKFKMMNFPLVMEVTRHLNVKLYNEVNQMLISNITWIIIAPPFCWRWLINSQSF